jgi:hypothetical protein
MIVVEALPAGDGDCLWLEWDHDGRWHRMLVDGGRSNHRSDVVPDGLAARFDRQPVDQRDFELVVCTHIDADHIGGLLALFQRPPAGFGASDVWFNGRGHLAGDVLGPAHGDAFVQLLGNRWPWNTAFGGDAVVVPERGRPPVVELPGLRLTLLSPDVSGLRRLARDWPAVVRDFEADASPTGPADLLGVRDLGVPLAELAGAGYSRDSSAANGSSIAFIVEHSGGARVLLGADAHGEVLAAGLRALRPGGSYPVDLCKAPHHGSRGNVSPGLLSVLDCRHWLISTDGARHSHPDRRAVARILDRCDAPELWFNYRSASNEEFADPTLADRFGARTHYPRVGRAGMRLAVEAGRVERA